MKNQNFVHLHLHDEYSQLDGFGTAENYIKRAKELGFSHLALTNHGNVDGLLKFQKECDKQGIKPVLGCEAYIVPNAREKPKKERRGHITILVKNQTGWQELCKLLTYANLTGFHHRPRIDYETLLNCDLSGFIIMTACAGSFLNLDGANDLLIELGQRMKGRVYLEIMPHDIEIQHKLHKRLIQLKKISPISYVATNDCFSEDTLILTIDGYKFIKDIKINDFVLTHKNRYKKVIHTNKKQLKKEELFYNLKTTIGSIVANVTKNHPYRICNYHFPTKQIKDLRWENVNSLEIKKDYLIIPKVNFISNKKAKNIDLLNYRKFKKLKQKTFIKNNIEYINCWRTDKNIKIPRFLLLDDNLLSIIGLYIANGYENNNQIGISVHKRKKYLLKRAKRYFEQFNLHPNLDIENECANLRFSSRIFADFFNLLCGKHAHNKCFPLKLKLNKRQTLKVLESYIACDGSCGNSLMICATTSIFLAYEISLVLNSLGFLSLPGIQNNQKINANWKPLYYLTLSGIQAHEFSKLVSLEKQYHQPKIKRKRFVENDDFYAVKLIDKQKIKNTEYIYNFEVEDDNSYIANNYIVHNCHYIHEDEWEAQEVLLAIQTKAKWADKDRFRFGFKGLHLRSADEMVEAFEKQGQFSRSEYLLAMRNTIKVAKECCEFRIPKQDISLPPVKAGWEEKDHFDKLKQMVEDKRLELIHSKTINELQVDEYNKRIAFELDIIKSKKFAAYFLIVHEVVQWCKKKGIMVGPGRGSVSGSLVANMIGITTVNPLEYGLLFERFIAEDRIDYPDIDLDFEDIRRIEVLQHLEELYGKYNVSGVSTFSKMKARGVIRDVGRVFAIPYKDTDRFAKAITDMTVEQATKETDEGKQFKQKYPEVTKLAIKLEGQVRNSGQHAAAMIVSNDDLRAGDRCNLCIRKKRTMINWDMGDSEYVGLIKLDILGLNTLTVLNETLRLIILNHFQDRDPSETYFQDIPLNDQKVFDRINKGECFGMFQLSAAPTTKLAQEIQVKTFEDIAIIIALVRPGPHDSGMAEEYIQRKRNYTSKGITWNLKHDIYEEITKDTYGILVYQEQVMQVISKVAGLPYSVADKIRKVIGKKRDAKEFKPYWEMFLKGCLKNLTMNQLEAEEFWEGLLKWASYGFNKAHSIGYALLGYWTGYFSVHYPTEFICAHLTYGTDGDKDGLLGEARKMGLEIIPPKIGISDSHKWTAKDHKLYVPFIEIKGIGDKTALQCVNTKTVKQRQMGFFDMQENSPVAKPGSSLDKALKQVGAYDKDGFPKEAQELFSFSLSGDKYDLYPNLLSVLGYGFSDSDLADYLELSNRISNDIPKDVIQHKRFRNLSLSNCKACELRQECKAPVLPSQGLNNVAICAEAPGPQEDKEGIGFYDMAPAGELLWKTIGQYGYKRSFFHVSNVCKCYPGRKIKTPSKKHIGACYHWLEEELKEIECRLILACGNTCIKAFTDRDSGISDLSGTTEWNERIGAWICWCMHPASVKHNAKNKGKFEAGIENFIKKLERLK